MLYIIIASVIAAVALLARLRWHERQFVPRNRVRSMRLRAHLRMRPGLGFASAFTLWWRFSRFAAFRKSSRIRPSLSAWQRMREPDEYSVKIGSAQRGMGVRIPHEEHLLVEGPPRTGKSGLLSAVIMDHRGPCLSTSTKPDMFTLTSGLRSQLGPVDIFNPQNIGGVPSTIAWSPTSGCSNPQTAARRAEAFANALSVKGTDGGGDSFWSSQAAEFLTGTFAAADMVEGGDVRLARHWLMNTGRVEDAEAILRAAGAQEMADSIAQLRLSTAQKTLDTVKMLQNRAFAFLQDPVLAASVLPDGNEFDIPAFLGSNGTLFMIASAQEDSPIAPIFSALAAELHYQASMLGQSTDGQRLDPPLRMALDEVTTICPVPLPEWLSDSGGKGIVLAIGCHSDSQLANRYGQHGAQTIIDTSGTRVYMPGIADPEMLGNISKLAGQFSQRARFQDHHSEHATVTEAMARELPDGYGLVLRGNASAVLAKLRRGWKLPEYRQARRQGRAIAAIPADQIALQPAAAPLAVDQDERPAVEAQPVGVTSSLTAVTDDAWEVRS